MPSIKCPHCGSAFAIPDDISMEVFGEMVRVRGNGIVPSRDVNAMAERLTDMHASDRKDLANHLVRSDGKCHSCQTPLEANGIVECPKCRAINVCYCAPTKKVTPKE